MRPGRPLAAGEWRALSAGLEAALASSGATPCIVAAAHPAARFAAVWRGSVAILTRGDAIFWPNAPPDLSECGPGGLATLQHELQHVLDYRSGRVTAARYLSDPREWTYKLDRAASPAFDRLGAEQRATLVERLWLAENGHRPRSEIPALRAAIPWAAQVGSLAVGGQASV